MTTSEYKAAIENELLETGLFDTDSEIEAAFLEQTVNRILSATKEWVESEVIGSNRLSASVPPGMPESLVARYEYEDYLKNLQRDKVKGLVE